MRQTDTEKIERVKLATIKTVVEKGYFGATISVIASEAGVSDGYLYRHYKNKCELVESLFVENRDTFHGFIFDIIPKKETVREVLENICNFILQSYTSNPVLIQFYVVLAHDHSFDFPEKVRLDIRKIGEKLHEKGRLTGEVGADTEIEDVLVTFFGLQSKMLEMYQRNIVSEEYFKNKAKTRIIELCTKAWA